MWLYASGFPKAQDVGKAIDKRAGKLQTKTYLPDIPDNREVKNSSTGSPRCNMCHTSYGVIHKKCSRDDCIRPWEQTSPDNEWAGWKTALKPAHEPIVMARKPFKGSTIDNVLTHGVGALNIDATRIPFEGKDTRSGGADGLSRLEFGEREPIKYKDQKRMIRAGRDPRNRLKDLETQTTPADHNHEETPVYEANPQGRFPSNVMGEITDYQKYFYCPKVSRRERHVGFEQTHIPPTHTKDHGAIKHTASENNRKLGNNHPTVKPVALMRYLIELVAHLTTASYWIHSQDQDPQAWRRVNWGTLL
jgi:hypothetical protein